MKLIARLLLTLVVAVDVSVALAQGGTNSRRSSTAER